MNLDFKKDYILENDVAKLIPLNRAHIENLLPFSIHEPEIWRFSLQSGAGKENLTKYIQKALNDRANMTSYPFIVFDKRYQTYGGCTRLYQINLRHRYLSVGYTWYGKKFRGTGLNKNCKFLLFEFAFEKLGIERIEFRADAKNQLSINAMKSIGCQKEGILRNHMYKPDGGRRDSIVLSILQDEWYANAKQQLQRKIQTPKSSVTNQ